MKFAAALTRALDLLDRMPLASPELGPSPDGSMTYRFATVRGFRNVVVVYVPLPDGIDVVHVVDGRRDLSGIVGEITP